jgi:hypothetical protein
MKNIQSSLLAAALGISGISAAYAAQTPNFYECAGKNVNLSLTVGSKAEVGILPPQTTFNLQVGRKSYSFQEVDITTESTLIGDLWEVTLNFISDLQIDHASVVIPAISLGDSPIRFKSQLILTRVATPFIPKPFEGVVNSSKYIDISCVASLVYY